MLGHGLIDDIVKEPIGGAHTLPEEMAKILKRHLKKEIAEQMDISPDKRIKLRIKKYSAMGNFVAKKQVVPEEQEKK